MVSLMGMRRSFQTFVFDSNAFRQGLMRGMAASVEVFDPPKVARRDLGFTSPTAGFERDREALRDDFRRAEAAILGHRDAGRNFEAD